MRTVLLILLGVALACVASAAVLGVVSLLDLPRVVAVAVIGAGTFVVAVWSARTSAR